MKASMEYLYGIHPVREALSARRRKIMEIYVQKEGLDRRRGEIAAMALNQGIEVRNVSAAKLKAVSGQSTHQGVAALAAPLPLTPLTRILPSSFPDVKHGIWLLLDGIVDPHNLGAVIRTAHCAGVKAVIIPKDRSAPISPTVSKASAGALEHMTVVRVTNLADTIKELKKHGLWVAGLDADASESVYTHDLTGYLAVVMGGEEKGIRPRVRRQCDFLLSIPQLGKVSSLNVSVAAAVVVFEALRQQQGRNQPGHPA